MWKFDSRYILNRGVFPMSIVDPDASTIYNRIIADGGVSNLTRLNFFVKGLKAIYGDLANVPVCYDAHWIGYKLGSGTGATAGQAAAKLYSLTVAGDAVQATAASQPLLLSHNGASTDNYWYGSGVAGNYVSTPNAVANQITGDIEITGKVGYVSSANQVIIAKPSMWRFYITTGNFLAFEDSLGATKYSTANIGSPFNGYVKIFRTTTEIKFYTSLDGITYTQLGSTVTSPTTLNVGAGNLYISSYDTSGNLGFAGKIYRATIANSIGGTPVVDFNPASYNAATSQTQWTSATGEVWTINTGTATSGYKSALVSRTIVQSDGVDDTLISSTLASRQYFTSILAVKMAVTANKTILGSTLDSHLIYTASNLWRAYNGIELTGSAANTNLNMISINFNNLTSSFILNANTPITGITGLQTSTNVKLFGGAGSFGNSTINTVLQSLAVIDSTQQTATYNLIRSLNENAF